MLFAKQLACLVTWSCLICVAFFTTTVLAESSSLIKFSAPCSNNHKLALHKNVSSAIQFSVTELSAPLPFNMSVSVKAPSHAESLAKFFPTSIDFTNASLTETERAHNISIQALEVGFFVLTFDLTTTGDIPDSFTESVAATRNLLGSEFTIEIIDPNNALTYSLMLTGTVLFGFSIGCSFPFSTLRTIFHRERSHGIAAATISQFLVVPIAAFLLGIAFKLSSELAVGAVIVAASPGGSIAPVFTYFMGGDMALSVSIGIIATCLATVFIPIILLICSFIYPQVTSYIPWLVLALSLLGLLLPVLLGMLTLHFKPGWAHYISRSAAFWGAFVVTFTVVMGVLTWKEMFLSNWEVYVTAIILGVVSITSGTALSYAFKLTPFQLRAVLMQTTLQNTPLALSIIQLASPDVCAPLIQLFPIFYTMWMLIMSIIVCLVCCFFFPVIPDQDLVLLSESEQQLPFRRARGNSFGMGDLTSPITMAKHDFVTVTPSLDRQIQSALKMSSETNGLNASSFGTPPAAYVTPNSNITIAGGGFSSVLKQRAAEDDMLDGKYLGVNTVTNTPTSLDSAGFVTPGEVTDNGASTYRPYSMLDWIPSMWNWSMTSTPAPPAPSDVVRLPEIVISPSNSSSSASSELKVSETNQERLRISSGKSGLSSTSTVVANGSGSEFSIIDAIEDDDDVGSHVHYSATRTRSERRVKFKDQVETASSKSSKSGKKSTKSEDDDASSVWESAEEYSIGGGPDIMVSPPSQPSSPR